MQWHYIKPHYACFECRKTFKRKLMWDIKRTHEDSIEAKCPECGTLMANMGLDFESPKKNNINEWNHLRSLYSVGITFHSCGCVVGSPFLVCFKSRPGCYKSTMLFFNKWLTLPESESPLCAFLTNGSLCRNRNRPCVHS